MPSPPNLSQYQDLINENARRTGVSPSLIAGVIAQESGGDPFANSGAAQGLMQLTPGTAQSLGVTDPYNPAQNVRGGSDYLSALLQTYNGNIDLALAAYNAGPGAVQQYNGVPPYAETQKYIPAVENFAAQYAEMGFGMNSPLATTGTGGGFDVGSTGKDSNGFSPDSPNDTTATGGGFTAPAGSYTPQQSFFAPVINAINTTAMNVTNTANNIAQTALIGALAVAFISGGFLWLAAKKS